MILKIMSVAGIVIVLGLLATTVPTTIQLSKIDISLNRSLSSTAQLVDVQNAIIQKNKSINQVVSITKQLSNNLSQAGNITKLIHKNIIAIDQINGETLNTNLQMEGLAGNSGNNLSVILQNMKSLLGAAQSLSHSIQTLDGVVQNDNNDLNQMNAATKEMNQKIPGVAG